MSKIEDVRTKGERIDDLLAEGFGRTGAPEEELLPHLRLGEIEFTYRIFVVTGICFRASNTGDVRREA